MSRLSKPTQSLNEMVNARYGIDIQSCARDREHLSAVAQHYIEKKSILEQAGFSLGDSSEYTKMFLISEAAKMLLREIAPKRKKTKKKK